MTQLGKSALRDTTRLITAHRWALSVWLKQTASETFAVVLSTRRVITRIRADQSWPFAAVNYAYVHNQKDRQRDPP